MDSGFSYIIVLTHFFISLVFALTISLVGFITLGTAVALLLFLAIDSLVLFRSTKLKKSQESKLEQYVPLLQTDVWVRKIHPIFISIAVLQASLYFAIPSGSTVGFQVFQIIPLSYAVQVTAEDFRGINELILVTTIANTAFLISTFIILLDRRIVDFAEWRNQLDIVRSAGKKPLVALLALIIVLYYAVFVGVPLKECSGALERCWNPLQNTYLLLTFSISSVLFYYLLILFKISLLSIAAQTSGKLKGSKGI